MWGIGIVGGVLAIAGLMYLGPWGRARAQSPAEPLARTEPAASELKPRPAPSPSTRQIENKQPAVSQAFQDFKHELAVADVTDSALASQDAIDVANKAERMLRLKVAKANAEFDIESFFAREEPDSEFYVKDWQAITMKRRDKNGADVLERHVGNVVTGQAFTDGASTKELSTIVNTATLRAKRRYEELADLAARLSVIVKLVAQRRSKPAKKAAASAEDNSVSNESPPGFVLVSYREQEPAKPGVDREGTSRKPAWSAHTDRVVNQLIQGR
jgi:hypothetical protein